MKRLLFAVSVAVFAALMIAAPYKVVPVNPSIASFEVSVNQAEAKYKASKSKTKTYKKKKKKSTTTTKKKTCAQLQNCTKSGKKGKLETDKLFKKGDKKGKAKAAEAKKKDQKPAATTQKKPSTTTAPKKKPTATAKKKSTIGTGKRPVMSTAKRKTTTTTRVTSLGSPKAKNKRLTTQRTRSSAMSSRTRSENRRLRSERNYWRSEAQYQRNRRYSSYDYYGWGYGYRPGYTYHSGWGGYGYGYTRGGLSVVDYMIIYSIFGHSTTSHGDTVVNNTYIINGEESEVTAVPEGSHVTGFGDKRTLVVVSEDGDETIEIPAGSTFTDTDNGMLITTPDGIAVLVPTGEESYQADENYQVPEEAQAPIEYGEFGNEAEDDWSWYNPFSWF